MNDPDELLTYDQSAALINTSKMFIRDQVDAGKLPAYRAGNSRVVRVRRGDLLALFKPVVEPLPKHRVRVARR